jgi:type IV secretion system protein VirD4
MSEIIVGKYHGRYLTAKHEQFVLVAAPTGSNKTTAVLLPNLLNYSDSVVCMDMKQENYRYTSLYRQRHGQQVYLWAPFTEEGHSHCWNMLDAIPRESPFRVGEVLAIAQSFYPSDCDPKEKFWNDNARNLFLALVLYLMETPTLPCTLGEVLRQSSGCGRPLKEHLEHLITARETHGKPFSNDCLNALHRFLSTPDTTLGNVIATFNAPMLVFANPVVDAATSKSDFSLADVRRTPMTIYVGIQPNRLNDASLLLNLFFSQLIDQNTRILPESDPTCRYECLIGLDEMGAIGKINTIAKSNGHIRGYRLRLLSMVQSVAQLTSLYGEADARTLMTDHAIQIAFPPREQRDADDYSKMLGFDTQEAVTTSVSSARGGGTGSTSRNTAEHSRALLLPQELKILEQHQQIIFAEYSRPILCSKARYYEDHCFLDRLKEVSPSLAALDNKSWRRHFRKIGLGSLVRVSPTEVQIKRAAFVLKEMSSQVPALVLRETPRLAAAPLRDVPQAAGIDLTNLEKDAIILPPFADSTQPTPQEAQAIVDAFFGPLEQEVQLASLVPKTGAGARGRRANTIQGELFAAGTQATTIGKSTTAGKRGSPGSPSTRARGGGIDLSALDL